jgi:pimeloyl-ACP methyl ester carboxylesterase
LAALFRANDDPDDALDLVAAENGKTQKTKLIIQPMNMLKIKLVLAAVLALQIGVAFADPVSDRITVTVRGNGPDVVLIPGLACSSAVWDATAKHLEDHYRLHIVQVAGFAGAPACANATGPILQPTVDAINFYIKTNHLQSPKIIGHSMGGLMGMMLAVQHPEDVGKLMIVDSLPFFSVLLGANDAASAMPGAAMMRDNVLSESQDAYAHGEEQFLRTMVKSAQGRKLATAWAVASDKSVVARAMYEDTTTDLRPELHKIKAPATLLYPWDSQSGFPREATDKLYRDNFSGLTGVKVLCIDGSFHFIMLDQPEKFAAAVDDFLKP